MAVLGGTSTSPLDAMDTTEATYFTSLSDTIWWSLRFIVILVVATALGAAIAGLGMHRPPSLLSLGEGCVAVLLFSVFLGLLLFCFGWMGRITVSDSGIKAPEYSGVRSFMAWQQIRTASRSTLSGWPCTVITGGQPSKVLYLMALGDRKREMIESIRRYADPNNVLVAYFNEHGI